MNQMVLLSIGLFIVGVILISINLKAAKMTLFLSLSLMVATLIMSYAY